MEKLFKKEYKKLDKMVKFNYKIELYLKVESFGFAYVSECIDNLYNEKNLSIRQIAKQLDKSPETILFWMRKWKYNRRPRGGNSKNGFYRTHKRVQQILALRGKKSIRECAQIVGCGKSTIIKIWKEANIYK